MHRWFPLVASVLVACAPPSQELEEREGAAQPIEAASEPRHFAVAAGLTGARADAQRATAVLLVPMHDDDGALKRATDGTPIRATCGSTFITRTHAITAAHCVPASDLAAGERFTAQLVDVAPDVAWRTAARVTGRFPDLAPGRATSGYTTTDLSCTVRARCGETYGRLDCPLDSDDDIALIECDGGLPDGRAPAAIAETDDEAGPVEMFWFHEIVDAPAPAASRRALLETGEAEAQNTAEDLYLHYTLTRGHADNVHYFGDGRNQIFPLASRPWSTTTPRRRLGARASGIVMTDLFGCHGTSGSGVFQQNARTGRLELLGPMAIGSEWARTRLCNDPESARAGEPSLGYSPNAAARAMAALAR